MAESKGFEPLVALTTQPFQDCTLNRSDNSPVPKYNTKENFFCQTKKSRDKPCRRTSLTLEKINDAEEVRFVYTVQIQ